MSDSTIVIRVWDNILVLGHDQENLVDNLIPFFERCRKYNLLLKIGFFYIFRKMVWDSPPSFPDHVLAPVCYPTCKSLSAYHERSLHSGRKSGPHGSESKLRRIYRRNYLLEKTLSRTTHWRPDKCYRSLSTTRTRGRWFLNAYPLVSFTIFD